MKRITVPAIVLALGALSCGMTLAAPGGVFRGHQLAGQARLSLGQARAIALKARPGAITDQQLEREPGGSGLRYSFDIFTAGKVWEVGVDAKTGKVLEADIETAAQGAAER